MLKSRLRGKFSSEIDWLYTRAAWFGENNIAISDCIKINKWNKSTWLVVKENIQINANFRNVYF